MAELINVVERNTDTYSYCLPSRAFRGCYTRQRSASNSTYQSCRCINFRLVNFKYCDVGCYSGSNFDKRYSTAFQECNAVK